MHLTDSTVRKLGLKPQAGNRGSIRIDPLSFISVRPLPFELKNKNKKKYKIKNKIIQTLGVVPAGGSVNDLLSALIMSSVPDLNVTQLVENLTNLTNVVPTNTTFNIGNNTFSFDIWNLLGINPGAIDTGLNQLGTINRLNSC